MSGPLLFMLLAILVVVVAQRLYLLVHLRRLRFAPFVPGEHLPVGSAPAAEAALLALAAPRLAALGFEPFDLVRNGAVLVSREPRPTWTATWRHAASGAWAVVAPAAEPDAGALYSVSYTTFYRDGRHLFTTSRRGQEMIAVHASFDWCDTLGSLEAQWETHRERMALRADSGIITEADELRVQETRLGSEVRAALLADGTLVDRDAGVAQFSWRGAQRFVQRYKRGMRALRRQPIAPELGNGVALADERGPALRALADGIALRAGLAAERGNAGAGFHGLLLLLTGVLSLLFFGWQFDWRFAALLVAVLALHELGHLLAMRWAGYRELRMFFVPLFGAVASGHNPEATPWRRVVVLLAGPLPGLLLGAALVIALARGSVPREAWLVQACALLLMVNLFNLLPLVPLDGGRVLEVLLLERRPRLRGLFAAGGALGILTLGVWTDSSVALVLAALLALGLPVRFRQARLLARLREALPAGIDSEGRWIETFAAVLAERTSPRLTYGQRFALARQVATQGMPAAPPRITLVAGLALYLFAIALPLAVLMPHANELLPRLARSAGPAAPDPAPAATAARLAAARGAQARGDVLLEAARAAEDGEDYELAVAHYRAALAPRWPRSSRRRAIGMSA